MPTIIRSPQLQAITRLELAAIAVDAAHRAVADPDLEFGGRAVIAPSGLKHLAQIHEGLQRIETAIHPTGVTDSDPAPVFTGPDPGAEPAPSLDELLLTDDENRVVQHVAMDLATDLHNALSRARAQLASLPNFADDPEFTRLVLGAALASGSRLGKRIHDFLSEPRSPARL